MWHCQLFLKGYVAENFVLQELIAAGAKDIACWHENTAEVEFLLEMNGALYPIEVKSGRATRPKSLNVFAEKSHPPFRTIMSARPLVVDEAHRFANIPLYWAGLFPKWAGSQSIS